MNVTITTPAGTATSTNATLVKIDTANPVPPGPTPFVPTYTGVAGSALFGFTIYNMANPAQQLPKLLGLGCKIYRQNGWYNNGAYAWPALFQGIVANFIAYPAVWPPSSASMAQWGNFCNASPAQMLVCENEPVGHPPLDYVQLLRNTRTAMKAAGNNDLLSAPTIYEATAGGRYAAWLTSFLGAPDIFNQFDLFDYHQYGDGVPENNARDLNAIYQIVAAAAAKQAHAVPDFMLGETGWTTAGTVSVPATRTKAQLPDLYAWSPLLYRCLPKLRYVVYFFLRDDGGATYASNYGVYNLDWTEKAPGLTQTINTAFGYAHAAIGARYYSTGVVCHDLAANRQRLFVRNKAMTVWVENGGVLGQVAVPAHLPYAMLEADHFPEYS